MAEYDLETLRQLKRGELPFHLVHEMQSSHKDSDRFFKMLAIAQESVPWDDRILLPYAEHLYIVDKPDKSRVVKCDCGHEFGDYRRNWKLSALVYVRDTEEKINEIYPNMLGCDPEWMHLREYICPGCGTLLEVEAVPPGYPVVFDFQPDIDTFYEKWLKKPLNRE
ncbi:acetone carboxylase subunit gamma [Kyrpidia spormannii]|uniref:Acetone carboxylase gamma subunit n=1 Tax=Kyrpidia spormannii TaxID=2055160 RepID=A0ACA8ZA32_9BACL|nr:acetone carboxylase subunit gamma [Kyrpidia spormannii]CAB3393193.1 Acetone carboxylase gamma subunit [Kyrpidia spormannii]